MRGFESALVILVLAAIACIGIAVMIRVDEERAAQSMADPAAAPECCRAGHNFVKVYSGANVWMCSRCAMVIRRG